MSQKRKSTKSSEERKAEYRNLLDRVEILQETEDTDLTTTDVMYNIFSEANSLFKDSDVKDRVKHTDEVLLDAKLVSTTSYLLYNVSDAINCAVDTYDPVEFARKIRSKLISEDDPDEELNWTIVYAAAESIMKYPPKLLYLYGGIGDTINETKVVKERKVRQRQNKQENVEKKEPEKITSLDKEEDSVDDTVKFLQWALNKEFEENGGKPFNYMRFLIDPHNFSATIENMFHFSFLVRDGRVNMSCEDGIITISPISQSDAKRARKAGIAYKQIILSIDMDEWQELIEAFQIRSCFLNKWKHIWEKRKRAVDD